MRNFCCLAQIVATGFFAGLLVYSAPAALGNPQATSKERNPAEKWVAAQVAAGKVADLRVEFPSDENRVLGAKFLEDLLTGVLDDVKPARIGVQIKGAIFKEVVDLTNATVLCEVWLEHCRFDEKAIFERASFVRNLSLEETIFNADATFNAIKVQGFYLQNTVFEGAVTFIAADMNTTFEAQGMKCNNKEQTAMFNSMKVGRSAFFNKARFEGPVNLVRANITNTLEAPDTQFCDEKEGADFNGIKVGDDAVLRMSVFEGPVDFASAAIGGKLVAEQALFNDPKQGVTFNGMKVQGAFLRKAVFEGPVNFVAADITISIEAQDAQFKNQHETIWLTVKCGRSGKFDRATFAGPVSFADATFMDLILGDIDSNAVVPQLDLARLSIKRQLRVEQMTIEELDARSVHVEGPAYFTNLRVKSSADLTHGDFASLDLSGSAWPAKAGPKTHPFSMQGTKYKTLHATPQGGASEHEALLSLANQSAYTADVYGNLEDFFKRHGYRGSADCAFIEGKRRERKDYPHGLRRFTSWVLDKFVGYGRRPWQAGIPCLAFVALGCALFDPKKMELQQKNEVQTPEDKGPQGYSRFWYSLGLFLPFVDLQANKVWKPKLSEKGLNHYMRAHILLGWILIPFLLAALSGLIK